MRRGDCTGGDQSDAEDLDQPSARLTCLVPGIGSPGRAVRQTCLAGSGRTGEDAAAVDLDPGDPPDPQIVEIGDQATASSIPRRSSRLWGKDEDDEITAR